MVLPLVLMHLISHCSLVTRFTLISYHYESPFRRGDALELVRYPHPRCNSTSTPSCFLIYHHSSSYYRIARPPPVTHPRSAACCFHHVQLHHRLHFFPFDSRLHEKCVHSIPSTYNTSALRDALMTSCCKFRIFLAGRLRSCPYRRRTRISVVFFLLPFIV